MTSSGIVQTFFLLLFAHALADFPLQGAFLAEAKNRHTNLGKEWWCIALPMHAFIHGGFVFLITASLPIALAEVVAHTAIDFAKCEGKISIQRDQILHILCKIFYVVMLAISGSEVVRS